MMIDYLRRMRGFIDDECSLIRLRIVMLRMTFSGAIILYFAGYGWSESWEFASREVLNYMIDSFREFNK